MKSLYVRARNSMYPGFGECAKCGANWGWKQSAPHPTKVDGDGNELRGIFLFCESCDKTVSLIERWAALDEWKAFNLKIIGRYYQADSSQKVLRAVQDILDTEYVEFPRN